MDTASNSNDPFDRQKSIDGWKNEIIENQVALILGVGGLGCSIAVALARLGIKKMFFLDFDTVDTTNLNRQILFSKSDVGRNKVDAAADGIAPHCVGDTQIETFHLDAVQNWAKIVELAKQSTVIFNNIDVGIYFDYAVLSLAKSCGIPYAAGSSYCRHTSNNNTISPIRTWVVECFPGKKGQSSFTLANKDGDPALYDLMDPSNIQSLATLPIPHDAKPATGSIGSSVLVCTQAGLQTVNHWAQGLMGFEMPNYTKADIHNYWKEGEILAWPVPEDNA